MFLADTKKSQWVPEMKEKQGRMRRCWAKMEGGKSADVEPNVGIACHTCLKATVPSSLNAVPFLGHHSHASTIPENVELALFSILVAAIQKPHGSF